VSPALAVGTDQVVGLVLLLSAGVFELLHELEEGGIALVEVVNVFGPDDGLVLVDGFPLAVDHVVLHTLNIDLDQPQVVDLGHLDGVTLEQFIEGLLGHFLGVDFVVVHLHGLIEVHAAVLVGEPHTTGGTKEPQLRGPGSESLQLLTELHVEGVDVGQTVELDVLRSQLEQPSEGLELKNLTLSANPLLKRNRVTTQVLTNIEDNVAGPKHRLHLI